MSSASEVQRAQERRRFERVDIGHDAQELVLDSDLQRAGVLRQLARGGFLMEPVTAYEDSDAVHAFVIQEPTENIRVDVMARHRYTEGDVAGFEFVDLGPQAAVNIGIIIGKYYEHMKA